MTDPREIQKNPAPAFGHVSHMLPSNGTAAVSPGQVR
jgi:hypothetical protein